MPNMTTRSLGLIPAVIIVVIGTVASSYHSAFFYKADGYISPRTAVRLGLMDDREAPFAGGLAFKRDSAGGYEYRDGSALAIFGKTRHTDIDIAAECQRLGGCEWRK